MRAFLGFSTNRFLLPLVGLDVGANEDAAQAMLARMGHDPDTLARSPRRTRRAAPVGYRSMPVTFQYGIPVVVVGLLVALLWRPVGDWYASLFPALVPIEVLDSNGEPLSQVKLSVCGFDQSMFGPSPVRRVCDLTFANGEKVEVSEEVMGRKAMVLVTAPGCGVDYVVARVGEKPPSIRLAPPRRIRGTVRSVAGGPLAGVRLLAIGGERRGVLFEETRSGADGTFVFERISSLVPNLVVRALMAGFAISERDHWVDLPDNAPKEHRELDFVLQPVPPVIGKLVPVGETGGGIFDRVELRILRLPGLDTVVSKAGEFELHGLPAEFVAQLLVAGLPADYTHAPIKVRAGQRNVEVPIYRSASVQGQVLDGPTGRGLSKVEVWHSYGPRGGRRVRCDDDGRFKIEGLPVGAKARLHVLVLPDAVRHPRAGAREHRDLTLAASPEPLVVHID